LSLILREEHRLRVFEKRVLRRIFRPKRDEVTGEWRKLHNEELRDLNSSPKQFVTWIQVYVAWIQFVLFSSEQQCIVVTECTDSQSTTTTTTTTINMTSSQPDESDEWITPTNKRSRQIQDGFSKDNKMAKSNGNWLNPTPI
jgi:hypothetical protein